MSVIMIGTLSSCSVTKKESASKDKTPVAPVFDNANADVKAEINNILMVYYKIKDALMIGEQPSGSGDIIYLPDNPIFRSFWESGKLLLSNAIFLAGQ